MAQLVWRLFVSRAGYFARQKRRRVAASFLPRSWRAGNPLICRTRRTRDASSPERAASRLSKLISETCINLALLYNTDGYAYNSFERVFRDTRSIEDREAQRRRRRAPPRRS